MYTSTVYFHSLCTLKITELSPFIGFEAAFLTAFPLAQTWHFDTICHLQKCSCVYNILIGQVCVCVWGGGGAYLLKGSNFPYDPTSNLKILSIFESLCMSKAPISLECDNGD